MTSPPSTTAFALLGLLALRSWTAYDLTQQMRRALRWAWPRSEANLYAEIKRLDALGLARAVEEEADGRSRTRYHITDAGRDALQHWLSVEEPARPQVQAEAVLRVFFADLGDADDLRRTLATTRHQIAEAMEETLSILQDYAGADAPFPERAHLNILFIRFMAGFHAHVLRWCDEVEAELDTWDSTAGVGVTPTTAAMIGEALALYRSTVEAMRAGGAATT